MPVILDRNKIRARGTAVKRRRPLKLHAGKTARANYLKIALINNMPDSALEDTEIQFSELLHAAAGGIPIRLKFYSLPDVTRGERVQQHLNDHYSSIDDLRRNGADGVIITGAEPRQPDLRDEPYWSALTEVFDWAERSTASAVLSCLAAHAGVLHSDGIGRHALVDKRFGVFDERKAGNHPLTRGAGERMRFPHSRWNELREDELAAAGYSVLTKSNEAGVNLFVKKKRECLFVHFQGHPEYGAPALLKEYRRDVGRFLRRERETYPNMPQGYLDATSIRLLTQFREAAEAGPRKDLMSEFPENKVARALRTPWRSPAVRIYRNWLRYIASRKTGVSSRGRKMRAARG